MKISILIFMALIANSTEDGIIPFIFGGARASQGQFPHQARIQTGNGNLHCSGAIISARWILTARHCVEPMKNPSNYRIVVGSVYAGRGDFYSIVKLVAYKDWDLSKDIGMIKVRGSIKFNQNVKAIQIGGGFIGGGQQVTISGWGKTEYGFTNNLMYTNLKTLSNQYCHQRIASRIGWSLLPIKQTDLCTLVKGRKGVCFGDSGSSLIKNNKIVGVVSRGIPCAIGAPDIFVRVSSFGSWIQRVMKSY